MFYAISKAGEKEIEDKSATQENSLRKRKHVNNRKSEWHISGISSSDSDFETDGTEDEFLPSIRNSGVPERGLRGFLAHQAASRKNGAPVFPQYPNIAGNSIALSAVRSRGQTFG